MYNPYEEAVGGQGTWNQPEPPGVAPEGSEYVWTGQEWALVPIPGYADLVAQQAPPPVAEVPGANPYIEPTAPVVDTRAPSPYAPDNPYTAPVGPQQDNSMFGGGAGDPTGSDLGLPQFGGPGVPVPVAAPAGPAGPGGVAGAPNMYPIFQGPAYAAPPQFQAPPAFSYDKFMAPSLADAQGEPGYDFAFREGLRAVQNAKAAQGALRTGATLKDLVKWGSGLAEQNYQNVYNRQADSYDRNRNNAANAYVTNYGVGRDVWDRNTALGETAFDRNYKSAWDTYSSGTEGQKATLDDLYRRWNAQLQVNRDLALAPIPGEEF